jgi:hypothetical protein
VALKAAYVCTRPSGKSVASIVDVALYTTACVDGVVAAHLEVDWEQLHAVAVEKGRRSPLAALAKQAARPDRRGVVNEGPPPRL